MRSGQTSEEKICCDFFRICHFFHNILYPLAGVKFGNIQITIKNQPLGVDSWLSPFWKRHDGYFNAAEEGVE